MIRSTLQPDAASHATALLNAWVRHDQDELDRELGRTTAFCEQPSERPGEEERRELLGTIAGEMRWERSGAVPWHGAGGHSRLYLALLRHLSAAHKV